MAISKVNFNSLNVTPTASKTLKFNSSNDGLEAGDVGGALVLLSTATASSSSTISFTSGIDSTYKEYIFKFIDIHPSNHNASFEFHCSIDGGSNYNLTITSTNFLAYNYESGGSPSLGYYAARDQAQGTSFQHFMRDIGNENDESSAGYLHLYDPSSTTFVKHFTADCSLHYEGDAVFHYLYGGYFNTTSAINAIQFKMGSGNIDSGTIKMYGVT